MYKSKFFFMVLITLPLSIASLLIILPSLVSAGMIKWTTSGPNCKVTSIGIPSYFDNKTMFVGSEDKGVAKSTDGGISWTYINNGLTDTNVMSLLVSPHYYLDRTIFAGTPSGVFRSGLFGQTSKWTNVATQSFVTAFAIPPNYPMDDEIFFSSLGNGIYKSNDGGSSWFKINDRLDVISLAIYPNYGSRKLIYAGLINGYIKSEDGGNTWETNFGSGDYEPSIGALSFDQKTLYAGTINGILKILDVDYEWQGWDWVHSETNYYTSIVNFKDDWGSYVLAGANSNKFPSIYSFIPPSGLFMFGGTISEYKSLGFYTDGLTNNNINALAVSPNYTNDHTIYAGTEDGLFSYTFDRTHPSVSFQTPNYSTDVSPTKGFSINWQGYDSESGIDAYKLYYRSNTSAWDIKDWSKDRKTRIIGKPGNTYYFNVEFRDKAGSLNDSLSVNDFYNFTIVPYNQTVANFKGVWSTIKSPHLFLGNSIYSARKDSFATYKFMNASTVSLIITKRPSGGYADVYIGAKKIKTVNFYSSINEYRKPVLIRSYNKPTSATLKVIVKGKKSTDSTGYRVELDGIAIKKDQNVF